MLRRLLFGLLTVALATPAHSQLAPVSASSRIALAEFGRCVAAASPELTRTTLTKDFTQASYRQGLKLLSENNRGCLRKRGTMRATGLPFAASLAEAMLAADPTPLKARLAKAAVGKAVPTYAPSDAIAMCVARTVPDEAAALLASPLASAVETEAAARLVPAARLCGQQVGATLEIEPFSLRSILATASYRLIESQAN